MIALCQFCLPVRFNYIRAKLMIAGPEILTRLSRAYTGVSCHASSVYIHRSNRHSLLISSAAKYCFIWHISLPTTSTETASTISLLPYNEAVALRCACSNCSFMLAASKIHHQRRDPFLHTADAPSKTSASLSSVLSASVRFNSSFPPPPTPPTVAPASDQT